MMVRHIGLDFRVRPVWLLVMFAVTSVDAFISTTPATGKHGGGTLIESRPETKHTAVLYVRVCVRPRVCVRVGARVCVCVGRACVRA